MNTPTLSQLADIGAKAALAALDEHSTLVCVPPGDDHGYRGDTKAREAFAKAVLDAVGYKLPVDPEREAFDAWLKEQVGTDFMDMKGSMFLSWKAGREELRKEVCSDKCEDTKTEPAWIEWTGGPCPLPDTVKRWEYRCRDGFIYKNPSEPSDYALNWEHDASATYFSHFVAYRVLDWGTTKQPE